MQLFLFEGSGHTATEFHATSSLYFFTIQCSLNFTLVLETKDMLKNNNKKVAKVFLLFARISSFLGEQSPGPILNRRLFALATLPMLTQAWVPIV